MQQFSVRDFSAQVMKVQVLVGKTGALERPVPRCPETVAAPGFAKRVLKDRAFGLLGEPGVERDFEWCPYRDHHAFLPFACFARILLPS
jgi:hypothetical protein